jgi:hypothetical protein
LTQRIWWRAGEAKYSVCLAGSISANDMLKYEFGRSASLVAPLFRLDPGDKMRLFDLAAVSPAPGPYSNL